MTQSNTPEPADGIAIIGMAGRFPGADTLDQFWENIANGVESITTFSNDELKYNGVSDELINNPDYVKANGILTDTSLFDARFFGLSTREAELIDPQHRVLLECAHESLEHAGYNPDTYQGLIGIFAGCGQNMYFYKNLLLNSKSGSLGDYQLFIGNDKDFISTRISYKLNLTGPSLNIQTACSTSLVAVHSAYQSLILYQCDIALAGAVSLLVPQKKGYLYQEGSILSPGGKCRPFDNEADGTVQGEGAGLVVLKRLEDAIRDNDTIHAVIRGAAINNDGSSKAGYTAPSISGQVDVIRMAMELSEVDPGMISYIEAHGTGTALGDPIEFSALNKVFNLEDNQEKHCAIGSVKANIGHLDTAAGIAGLIKCILCLKNKKIPPQVNFNHPNPQLDVSNSPFYFNSKLTDWQPSHNKRICGISSFGIGGTNAHVILEEATGLQKPAADKSHYLLVLSARTTGALEKITQDIRNHLLNTNNLSIADVAFTLQAGRRHLQHRRFLVCGNTADAIEKLGEYRGTATGTGEIQQFKTAVTFMFSGQGSQYTQMSADLYQQEARYQVLVDGCLNELKKISTIDLRAVLFPDNSEQHQAEQTIHQTLYTQLVLFIVEYSLAKLLINWGIVPQAMIGHSIGEYTAACIAGVFSLHDALEIIYTRALLMNNQSTGSMLAVTLSENELNTAYLSDSLSLAVINGDELCVVSGTDQAINDLKKQLDKQKTGNTLLKTSHAFHSHLMEPVLAEFHEKLKKYQFNKPAIPFISNVTGEWINDNEAQDPEYWCRHLRSTVQFHRGIQSLNKHAHYIFLEVGPGNTLCSLINNYQYKHSTLPTFPTLPHRQSNQNATGFFYTTLGNLWLKGASIDWPQVYGSSQPRRIPLPTYPFERKSYWLYPEIAINYEDSSVTSGGPKARHETVSQDNQSATVNTSQAHAVTFRELIDVLTLIWKETLGLQDIQTSDNFFSLGGQSVIAAQLVNTINNKLQLKLTLRELITSPTIEKLARYIESHNSMKINNEPLKNNFPVLFPVQPEGDKPALFLVAGAHANRYYDTKTMKISYEEDFLRYISTLIPHLGLDQPIYGFRPRGLVAWEKQHKSVEEMAAEYIREIKKFQPQGPYIIGGECVGGIVAYEMAQQLNQTGAQTSILILMDTPCPSFRIALREAYIHRRRVIYRKLIAYIKAFTSLSISTLFAFLKQEIKRIIVFLFPVTKRMREHRRLLTGSYKYQKTLLRYRPQKYNGPVSLFINEDWYKKSKSLWWPDKLTEQFTISCVPGDHATRLTKHGDTLGKAIKEAIGTATS